jgi:uncharacterized membrane protein YsdA (DUF1294 family)
VKDFLLILVLAMNAATFLAFGFDKWRARRGGRRTPEATLLLLAFLTGFPGGWLGMTTFRHKTRKGSFRARMFLVTLVNPLWLLLYLALRGLFPA